MTNKTPFELRHESLLIAKDLLTEQYHSERERIESKYNALPPQELTSFGIGTLTAEERKTAVNSIDKELQALSFPTTEAILEEAKKYSQFIEGRPHRGPSQPD